VTARRRAGRALPARDTGPVMSRENVELVRSVERAGDPSRWFDLLDAKVEVDFAAYPVPGPAVLHGKDAAINWFRRWWGTWDEYVLEASEIIDADKDRVVVVQYERGRGRGSGVRLERRWAVLYTLRMGKVAKVQPFKTREKALEAAGLSE
jgi:ketosteroid isomerase-like protein